VCFAVKKWVVRTKDQNTATEVHRCSQRSDDFIIASVHRVLGSELAAVVVSIVHSTGGYKPLFPIPEMQSAFHPSAR